MNRARTLTTFRAADEASNRFQEHVKEVLNPVLRELGAPEGWQAPVFLNAWVQFGAGSQLVGFFKDAVGIVHLRGAVSTGTVGAPAFTLPPSHSPQKLVRASTVSNGLFGRVDIDAGGNVIPQSPSSNAWVSLDCITFDTRP